MEQFVFTEIVDSDSSIIKRIEVLPDGTARKSAQAHVKNGTAKTLTKTPIEFQSYLESLNARANTCIVTAIWEGSSEFLEYDICLDGQEDPANGRVSRTKKFFKYANSDHVSFMVFDIDGDWPLDEVHRFISMLEAILKDAIIIGTGSRKLMRFEKPSASAGIAVNGERLGHGMHIWIPVRNMKEELVKQIFRWAWMNDWPSHLITSAASIEPRTIIDGAVGTPSRLFFEADAEVFGNVELVERIERRCSYYPGGILDCEMALGILSDLTYKFGSEWATYKAGVVASPEYAERKRAAVAAEKARRALLGQGRAGDRAAVLLFEEQVILSSDFLEKSDGTQVPVYEILTDRDNWLGERGFVDPIKPEKGTNKAMIVGDENSVRLKSFAHGGIYYYLRFDVAGLEQWVDSEDIDTLLDCAGSFIAQTVGTEAAIGSVIKKIAKLASTTVGEIKKDRAAVQSKIHSGIRSDQIELQIEQSGEASGVEIAQIDPKSTHAEIATDMLRSLGRCRSHGSSFYVGEKDIWRPMRAESLVERISNRYKFCELCKRGSDYRAIADLVFNKEEAYFPEWNSGYGIPCVSEYLRVGPDVSGEVRGRQVRGAQWVGYSLELGARFKLGFNPDWDMELVYWRKVLDNVVNPRCFQQAFGLALAGYLTKGTQSAAVLFGEGGTGKGTTNKVLTEMLPRGCVTAVSLNQMSDEKACIPLVDSVINIIPEIRNSGKAQITEGFKKATGGDMMQAHRMYKGPVSFIPTATQIININDWPILDAADEAIKRRVGYFIVEFKKNYTERIDNLGALIIERELPGVLAWAIDGIIDYFENGPDSEYSLQLFDRWTKSFDSINSFVADCIGLDDGRGKCGERKSDVWKVYKKYCEDSGWFPTRKGQFFDRVERELCQASVDEGWPTYQKLHFVGSGHEIALLLGVGRKKTR